MRHIALLAFLLVSMPTLMWADGLSVQGAYVREPADNVNVTAGYGVVMNTAKEPRRIVRASSNKCRAVELHTHTNENGVMKMRPVADVPVPARGQVEFAPGGLHFMLIGLSSSLKEGDSVPITLEFDNGETVAVTFPVRRITLSPTDHNEHSGHAMHASGGEGDGSHHEHANHDGHSAPDMVPPAGVMGAHMHHPGAWIVDFRSMSMGMNHIQDGTATKNPYEVLWGIYQNPTVQMPMTGLSPPSPFLPAAKLDTNDYRYMSTGTKMSMQMGMLCAMYQASADTMLMLMVPYVENRMEMLVNNYQTSPMAARGMGDVSASALFRVKQGQMHALFAGVGVSLPTGSIDEKDVMPQMGKSQLSYSMQPGAGTYAVLPEIDYTGHAGRAGWGMSLKGTLFAAKNDNNYRPGNRYSWTAWTSWRIIDFLSGSVRVQENAWANYAGQDPSLDRAMDPGNDPMRQGGRRTEVFIGINAAALSGAFAGTRVLMEIGKPVRQRLNGPQMAEDWAANFGVQYAL